MASLGDLLRQSREAKGLSVPVVSGATKIREHILIALETESYDELPAPVFVRGFLRTLARYLGLNADELLSLYAQAVPQTPPAPDSAVLADIEAQARPAAAMPVWLKPNSLVAGLIAVVVIAGIVWGGSQILQGLALGRPGAEGAPTAGVAPTVTSRAATTPVAQDSQTRVPLPTPSPAPVFVTATPTPTPARTFEVRLEITKRSWLKVEADGSVVQEGVLEIGDNKTVTARSRVTMRSGNAAGVTVSVNGQTQAPLGGDGDVADRQWVLTDSGVIALTTPTWSNPPFTPTPAPTTNTPAPTTKP